MAAQPVAARPREAPATPLGAQTIDAMVKQQTQIVARNDDFKVMVLPMLLLRRRRSGVGSHASVIE